MPTSKNKGGIVRLAPPGNQTPYAGVEEAISVQNAAGTGDWTITFDKIVPSSFGFSLHQNLIYNAKGTSNTNANNSLTITQVVGPYKFKCSGPYPINI